MVKVTGSPKIQESMYFGTDICEDTEKLCCDLHSIEQYNCKVINIDTTFGYIIVALPNPAIDYEVYKSERFSIVSKIEGIVNSYGGI